MIPREEIDARLDDLGARVMRLLQRGEDALVAAMPLVGTLALAERGGFLARIPERAAALGLDPTDVLLARLRECAHDLREMQQEDLGISVTEAQGLAVLSEATIADPAHACRRAALEVAEAAELSLLDEDAIAYIERWRDEHGIGAGDERVFIQVACPLLPSEEALFLAPGHAHTIRTELPLQTEDFVVTLEGMFAVVQAGQVPSTEQKDAVDTRSMPIEGIPGGRSVIVTRFLSDAWELCVRVEGDLTVQRARVGFRPMLPDSGAADLLVLAMGHLSASERLEILRTPVRLELNDGTTLELT